MAPTRGEVCQLRWIIPSVVPTPRRLLDFYSLDKTFSNTLSRTRVATRLSIASLPLSNFSSTMIFLIFFPGWRVKFSTFSSIFILFYFILFFFFCCNWEMIFSFFFSILLIVSRWNNRCDDWFSGYCFKSMFYLRKIVIAVCYIYFNVDV